MVTEVWAEPQHGRLTALNSELKYLEGLQYNEVPNAVSVLYGLGYITGIYGVQRKPIFALPLSLNLAPVLSRHQITLKLKET